MQREINLLPQKNVGFLEKERTIAAFRVIAIFSVIIVTCSFLGVILLGRSYSLTDIQAQQASVRSKLSLQKGKITKDLLVVDRANHIQNILKTRSSLLPKISALQKQVPTDVNIESFSIADKSVNISVTSTSLASLKKFLDSLTAMVEKKMLFSKITINNIVVDTTKGSYGVDVQGVLE